MSRSVRWSAPTYPSPAGQTLPRLPQPVAFTTAPVAASVDLISQAENAIAAGIAPWSDWIRLSHGALRNTTAKAAVAVELHALQSRLDSTCGISREWRGSITTLLALVD